MSISIFCKLCSFAPRIFKKLLVSVATSDRWKDKATGEQRERTEWHRVVIFNDALGRIAEQILKKGSTVYIEGQLQTSKYTDQQSGQEKYSTQVVIQRFKGELTLLSSRNETSMNSQNETNAIDQNNFEQPNQNQVSSNIASDLDDEIPF